MSDQRGEILRVEEGLSDILRHLESQRSACRSRIRAVSRWTPMVDTIKRELSDIRFSQSETNRSTQDSLEAVHNTLGHVVDRLSQIEGDLRNARSAPAAREVSPATAQPRAREAHLQDPPHPTSSFGPVPRPEMPNPAAAQAPIARTAVMPSVAPPVIQAPALAPILRQCRAAGRPDSRVPASVTVQPDRSNPAAGSSAQPGAANLNRLSSSERIAASEGVLNEISAGKQEPVSSANFIQAARRARRLPPLHLPRPARSRTA